MQAQTCTRCDKITDRYGVDNDGHAYCYRCCAERDLQAMHVEGRAVLYLSLIEPQSHHTRRFNRYVSPRDHNPRIYAAKLTNWPGSLTFDNVCISHNSTGHHTPNAGYMSRYDVWFTVKGDDYWWHGVQYGDFTQLTHCRRTKQAVTGTYRTMQATTDGYNG